MKILVVDDAQVVRRLISISLERMGYRDLKITEAVDGEDALAKAEREPFDVVLTDWMMPNVNGISLVKSLRSMRGYEKVPIIMITSNNLPEQIGEALRTDITDYIVKPFAIEVFRQKISAIVGAAPGPATVKNKEVLSYACFAN